MIIPAIDLQNGQVVRLFKGDFTQKNVYGNDPVEFAKKFESMGAKRLHIVDLDGAKGGNTANFEAIKNISKSVSIPIQVGGGIRSKETVALYLEQLKIDRIILGTVAVQNPEFLSEMIAQYGPGRIIVSVDVRNGKVSTNGWLEESGTDYLEFIEKLKLCGVKTIIVTDILKDGTLTEPNWDMYNQIKDIDVIVSGGVSSEADIEKAKVYYGVIVGKAYYEGKVELSKLLCKRIIPCLDIKDGKVVKGVNFAGLTDIGDPLQTALNYQKQGADEIVLLDITATTEGRATFYPLLKTITSKLSIPVTVGGGIRTIEDFRKCFECGAAKASVNSAAVQTPELIRQASQEFGCKRVVVAIDGKKVGENFRTVIEGGNTITALDLVEWAKKCEELGAGEILLTSMDADGMQTGYDIEFTKAVVDAVRIPVIASGGCGCMNDIINVFEKTDCDAALAASLFHYEKATVNEVKEEMKRRNIPCSELKG